MSVNPVNLTQFSELKLYHRCVTNRTWTHHILLVGAVQPQDVPLSVCPPLMKLEQIFDISCSLTDLSQWKKLRVAFLLLCCLMCRRMIEEGSKRGKATVEKRQLFMEMSESLFTQWKSSHTETLFKCKHDVILFIKTDLREMSFLLRSSKLRCHQTLHLQDRLQTAVCAEEMQP